MIWKIAAIWLTAGGVLSCMLGHAIDALKTSEERAYEDQEQTEYLQKYKCGEL